MLGALLAAQSGGSSQPNFYVLGAITLFVGLAFLSYALLLAKHYKRCPPNRLLVIYGRTNRSSDRPKLIHGGAAFVVPLLQDYAYLSLEPMDVELSTACPPEAKRLGFALPRKFTVAISTAPDLAETAAARLLGLTVAQITSRADEAIGSAVARTLDGIGHSEVGIDPQAFHAKLEAEICAALKPLGLELVSVRRI
jgi:flotillin